MKLCEKHCELYGMTSEQQFFDTKSINTMEASNIQQAAALSFQDWGKVPPRSKSSNPFVGRGIFSEDGACWKNYRDLDQCYFLQVRNLGHTFFWGLC